MDTFQTSDLDGPTTTSGTTVFNSLAFSNDSMYERISQEKSSCLNITHLSQVRSCNVTVYYFYPSELLWVGAVFSLLFAFLGTAGNLVSIAALLRSRKLRNATTAFIVNLCVSDLLFSAVSMPLTSLTFIHRDWRSGDALCKLFALVKYCNGIVSVFTVVAITINRYVLIVHPRTYPGLFTKRNTALAIAFLWFLPFALLFLPFLELWGSLGFDPETGYCGVMNLNGRSPRNFIFVGATVLPAMLFIGCYLRIYFVVRRSVRKVSRAEVVETVPNCQCVREVAWYRKNSCTCFKPPATYVHFRNRKDRLLRVVMAIFVIFVLSTFPLAYIKIFHKEYDLRVLNILGYIAYFSSNVINPLIYIVMSEEYRRAYKDLFLYKRTSVSHDDCIEN